MEFLLGCNYWASNAGIEMWNNFDIKAIDKDLSVLSSNGIKYLRVFPNWRDFQPVSPLTANRGKNVGFTGDKKNYYLDSTMLNRFDLFLDTCSKYGIKVIVGLVTGFMSSAMLVPPALYNKNIITDSLSQYFQQLYIKGFVTRFKERKEIIAWDLGNECNEMESVKTPFEAATWTAMVSNAIRACDNTRPVVSGMHYLDEQDNWKFSDQAEYCDILTTHPYPYWCEGTRTERTLSLRNTVFSTAYTKFYEDMGGKPCLAEEMGTMGPMVCSNEGSADFLRASLFSLWAHGSLGAMWWCASDQEKLNTHPYTTIMVERELGLFTSKRKPKPALLEIKKFSEFLSSLDFELPKAKTDAVCILTRGQHNWTVGFMTYILASRCGLNLKFAYAGTPLPDSDIYIMPSINGNNVIPKERYEELKARVSNGSTLYLSLDNAILEGFESFCGVKVIDSYEYRESVSLSADGRELCLSKDSNIILKPTKARTLAYDSEGNPIITENNYKNGKVLLLNAPIEKNLVKMQLKDAPYHLIYKEIFKNVMPISPIRMLDDEVLFTLHKSQNGFYVVLINHSDKEKSLSFSLEKGYKIDKLYYGSYEKIAPYDACVFKIV